MNKKEDLPYIGFSPREEIDLILAEMATRGGMRGGPRISISEKWERELVRGLLSFEGITVSGPEVGAVLARRISGLTASHAARVIAVADSASFMEGECSKGIFPDWEILREAAGRAYPGMAPIPRKKPPSDPLVKGIHDSEEALEVIFKPEKPCLRKILEFTKHDLHPLEKAGFYFWRLLRLSPFPFGNVVLAILGLSGYLISKGYPPFIVDKSFEQEIHDFARTITPFPWEFLEQRILELVKDLRETLDI